MNLSFRTFTWTDADVDLLVSIYNAGQGSEWTRQDIYDQKTTLAFSQREFIVADDQVIGSCFCEGEEGCYSIGLRLIPEHREKGLELPLIQHVMEFALSQNAKQITFDTRTDCPGPAVALQELGFECIHRNSISEFDLADYKPVEPALPDGIRLRSLPEIQTDTADWAERVCQLRNTLIQDVHLPDPHRDFTVEQLLGLTKERYWFPEGWIFALDGEEWIGMTYMIADLSTKDDAFIGLTGVLPRYRRRGIAKALKVACLNATKRAGISKISSDNEEHNPMLRLNEELGFKELYAYEVYRLAILPRATES